MKKRLLAVLLTIVMVCSLIPTALAAPPSNNSAELADALHQFGLFNGTGTDANGNPTYSLERAPTRQEALVMLIRLLGKETEALATTATHPFTDVDAWADKYVAYAYQTGLTKGTGATTFGGQSLTDAQQYVTFLLRALGYDDSKGDFAWNTALSFSDSIGLTAGKYALGEGFLRGDMVWLSSGAMLQATKSGKALVKKLQADGAIDDDQYINGLSALMYSQLREQFSTITVDGYPGTWTVNVADLYAEPGAGEFAGYYRLHNYGVDDKYPIYFKGQSGNFQLVVDEIKNMDDICTWSYRGHTYQNTRRDVYNFFDDTSEFASHFAIDGGLLSTEWFSNTFGQFYSDWAAIVGFTSGSANRLVQKYVEYHECTTYYEPRTGLYPELYFDLFDFEESWTKQEMGSDWISETSLSQLSGKNLSFGLMPSSLSNYALGAGKVVYGFSATGIAASEILFIYDMPESFYQQADGEATYSGIRFKKVNGDFYFSPEDLKTVGLLKEDGTFNDSFVPQSFDQSKAAVELEWVNGWQMENLYQLSAVWMGEEIRIIRSTDGTQFKVTGGPTKKMEPGVTYTGTVNGKSIQFQYDGGLIFKLSDLKAAGIIAD